MVGGIGRWRGLVSRGFRRLAALDSASDNACASSVGTSRLSAALLASSKTSDVDEERPDLFRDGDMAKEELGRRVLAPGGGIGGVLCTWDVFCVY